VHWPSGNLSRYIQGLGYEIDLSITLKPLKNIHHNKNMLIININKKWLSFFLFFIVTLFASAKDDSLSSNYIKITMLSLVVGPTNTVVKLSIQSRGYVECLRISRFSIENVIRNGIFYDTGGMVWVIVPQGKDLVIDPPTFDVDYETKLDPDKNTIVKFNFDGFMPLIVSNATKTYKLENKYPISLSYHLFGEVGSSNCNSTSLGSSIAGGVGNVSLTVLK
jgi:hypothetical protein